MIVGTTALVLLLAVGTLGYMGIEGWTAMDAFYMTFITLTTIGFAEVAPLSDAGKVFTIGLAF
ncbi:MAG: potassium channel family protein, partial [Bacteroidota bacterium]